MDCICVFTSKAIKERTSNAIKPGSHMSRVIADWSPMCYAICELSLGDSSHFAQCIGDYGSAASIL